MQARLLALAANVREVLLLLKAPQEVALTRRHGLAELVNLLLAGLLQRLVEVDGLARPDLVIEHRRSARARQRLALVLEAPDHARLALRERRRICDRHLRDAFFLNSHLARQRDDVKSVSARVRNNCEALRINVRAILHVTTREE